MNTLYYIQVHTPNPIVCISTCYDICHVLYMCQFYHVRGTFIIPGVFVGVRVLRGPLSKVHVKDLYVYCNITTVILGQRRKSIIVQEVYSNREENEFC